MKSKKREEAWTKINTLAKQNPTYEQIASTLNNCDDYWLYDYYNNFDDDEEKFDKFYNHLIESEGKL